MHNVLQVAICRAQTNRLIKLINYSRRTRLHNGGIKREEKARTDRIRPMNEASWKMNEHKRRY